MLQMFQRLPSTFLNQALTTSAPIVTGRDGSPASICCNTPASIREESRRYASFFLPRASGSTQNTRKVGLLEALRQQTEGGVAPEIEFAAPGVTSQEGYTRTKLLHSEAGQHSSHLLVAAFSDPLAIGAVRALREAGLAERSVVVGQGGTVEGRRHIFRGGPMKASVAYFPESYGARVLKLAIKICEGARPALVTHTDHVVLTKDNISDFYTQKEESLP